jgi:ABC-type enterobactin transport system permease subunit
MKDGDWVLGDMVWAIVGLAVVLGLMALNAYVQHIARIEEAQRIRLLGSDPLNRQRSAASQSRRPDDI